MIESETRQPRGWRKVGLPPSGGTLGNDWSRSRLVCTRLQPTETHPDQTLLAPSGGQRCERVALLSCVNPKKNTYFCVHLTGPTWIHGVIFFSLPTCSGSSYHLVSCWGGRAGSTSCQSKQIIQSGWIVLNVALTQPKLFNYWKKKWIQTAHPLLTCQSSAPL